MTASTARSSITIAEHPKGVEARDVEAGDAEAQQPVRPKRARHWQLVLSQTHIVPEVINHKYRGSGTDEDPYCVEFIPHDPRNPMNFKKWKKWLLTVTVAISTLAVTFVSSAYSGGARQILEEFGVAEEIVILGVSLFVLGFAIGPLLWGPLSELYGRQLLFTSTYAGLTAFNAGAAGSNSMATLIILRFFAGAIGSSSLTNAGGVIADMFSASERGLAMSVFAAAPFLGPTVGPIVGGFVGETVGWRWVEGVMAIFTGVVWIVGTFAIPETYAPVILRRRAAKLSEMTGKIYRSQMDIRNGPKTVSQEFKIALTRPLQLLFQEPIVLLLSTYMAIIYGTLYMMFSGFPIVYQQGRGWTEGVGGLAFIGVAIGMMIAVIGTIPDNKRYLRAAAAAGGSAPPEARLPPCMVGAVALPIGLFWFAWTNSPSIHWSVSIIGTAPFGFGMVLVFLSIMNYLIDSYVIYAASVLAANSVLRSLFGTIFPLFTTQMYNNLGIHWASSIPAFLALACLPFPFLFYKYGEGIRLKCKYAAEAAAFLESIRKGQEQADRDSAEQEEQEAREKAEHDARMAGQTAVHTPTKTSTEGFLNEKTT